MTLKLKDIINLFNAIDKIKNYDLPPKTSYKVAKLYNSIKSYVESWNETNRKLIDKYSTSNDDGEKVIKDENKPSFYNEIEKLLEQEENVDIDVTFEFSEFESINLPSDFFICIEKFML